MNIQELAQQILFRLAGTVPTWAPAAIGGLLVILALLGLAVTLFVMSTRAPR